VRKQLAWVVSTAWIGTGCSLIIDGSGPVTNDASVARDGGVPAPDDAAVAEDAGESGEDATFDAAMFTLEAGPPDAGGSSLCSDDPALVVCYPFDGDALDHGPRENHLDATAVGWDPGGGVLLNASSGLVRAHRAELSHDLTTIVTWVRVDVMPAAGRSVILDHDGQYGMFVHPGGELRCALGIVGAAVLSKPDVLEEGQWHHVACLAEDGKARLYVDGQEQANTDAPNMPVPGASPLQVGENAPTGADQLIGAIDDLRIIEAEWTKEEVEADAARGR
jgi:hypothetical protein